MGVGKTGEFKKEKKVVGKCERVYQEVYIILKLKISVFIITVS